MTINNNPFARYYALNSKEFFPSADPSAQAKRTGTTFYGDFKVAEAFTLSGDEPDALEKTWRQVWNGWKNNAAYMIELCLVMNNLCWDSEALPPLCNWYGDKYQYCRLRIFSDGSESEPLPEGCDNFTDEEKTQAFKVLD